MSLVLRYHVSLSVPLYVEEYKQYTWNLRPCCFRWVIRFEQPHLLTAFYLNFEYFEMLRMFVELTSCVAVSIFSIWCRSTLIWCSSGSGRSAAARSTNPPAACWSTLGQDDEPQNSSQWAGQHLSRKPLPSVCECDICCKAVVAVTCSLLDFEVILKYSG